MGYDSTQEQLNRIPSGIRSGGGIESDMGKNLVRLRCSIRAILARVLAPLVSFAAAVSKSAVKNAFKAQFWLQWSFGEPPEHFDHEIDLYWQWGSARSSFWLERGVFSSLSLKGGAVLELACGDGLMRSISIPCAPRG